MDMARYVGESRTDAALVRDVWLLKDGRFPQTSAISSMRLCIHFLCDSLSPTDNNCRAR